MYTLINLCIYIYIHIYVAVSEGGRAGAVRRRRGRAYSILHYNVVCSIRMLYHNNSNSIVTYVCIYTYIYIYAQ